MLPCMVVAEHTVSFISKCGCSTRPFHPLISDQWPFELRTSCRNCGLELTWQMIPEILVHSS